MAQWPVPKAPKKLPMEKIKNMDWNSQRKKKSETALTQPLASWTVEIDEILMEVQNANQTSALMTLRSPFSDHFQKNKEMIETAIQQQPEDNTLAVIYLYFAQFYKQEYEKMNLEELRQIACDISIIYTTEQIELVERLTNEQANSKYWYRFRAGRVTASVFYSVCRTSLINPSKSLILKICWPEKHIFSTIATNHGKKNEPTARNLYYTKQKEIHKNLKITECGLIINSIYPYFGASPDGIVKCECCGEGVLEIKCPFKPIKKTAVGICVAEEKIPAILLKGGKYTLNENHYFFYQVQMQIFLRNVVYGDFILFANKNVIIARVLKNEDFWKKNYVKAENFSKNWLIPEMLGKYVTNKKKNSLE